MAIIKLNNQSISAITSAGLPAGSVIQVVSSGEATPATINSTSFVLSVSLAITPSSSSNKIFIQFDGQYQQDDANNAASYSKLTRTIGGTETQIFDQFTGRDLGNGAISWSPNYGFLDTVNTTSEVTYKLFGRTENSTSDWRTRPHTILNAFEIKG